MGQKGENRDGKAVDWSDFYFNNQLPIGVAMGMGKITDVDTDDKFGQIVSRDTNDGLLPVWEENEAYPYQYAAYQPFVASTDVNDTLLGTGARIVTISGNSDLGVKQSEDIEMNGQTPVQSQLQWSRNYRMRVKTAGANKGAIGNIYTGLGTFTAGVPVTKLSKIVNGNNTSLMTLMTVPLGYHIAITSISYSTVDSKPVIFKNKTRNNDSVFDVDSVFTVKRVIQLGSEGNFNRDLNPPSTFPELTDIETNCEVTINGTGAEASFKYILIPNDWYERRL